jgi:type II secretory ATPase GspE/PulE/Tfp pilus assembly ATPase PilB-like protein
VTSSALDRWQGWASRARAEPGDAVSIVESLLAAAGEIGASDVHVQPTAGGLEVQWRLDGVLQPAGTLPAAVAPNVIARLKVLADLLTYRLDVPQEGRLCWPQERQGNHAPEMRLSTFPTLHGERAVIRLFGGPGGSAPPFQRLADLGMPEEIRAGLELSLASTSGAVLVTGPAGCGKTTTAYTCLREIAARGRGRSIVSLEDPIELAIPGVAQSQANPAAGFDLASGLRFLLRQDPEVILVGEIRDRDTAEVVMQASLTGHFVLSTFHAGSAAAALGRLFDMGIEPYLILSGILTIVSQRLVRRLCECKQPTDSQGQALGLAVGAMHVATGCPKCHGTGYRGRVPIAEMLTLRTTDMADAVLARLDAQQLEQRAVAAGMVTLERRACQAIEQGLTSPAEVVRVLGLPKRGQAAVP